MKRRGGSPLGKCALGHKPSSFVRGQDDSEAYVPGCSWQKPYTTQEREKIDRHRRPVVHSQLPYPGPADGMGWPIWGIPVESSP